MRNFCASLLKQYGISVCEIIPKNTISWIFSHCIKKLSFFILKAIYSSDQFCLQEVIKEKLSSYFFLHSFCFNYVPINYDCCCC